MPSYTVKSGDTLSGIGASHGVDWRGITGYRSGNANLIYPGEVVSWGAPTPAAAPAPAPAPAPAAAADPWAGRVEGLFGEVGTLDQNAQNPLDVYNAALERLGISDARTRVTDLRGQLLNTENLLRNVAGDVQARTQNSLVTENQRRRLTAVEQEPLSAQAGVMGRNLEMANADYQGILGEGKTQTDYSLQGDAIKRQGVMDRLQIAIDGAKSAEDKRRWQAEYDRLLAKDKEEARRWEAEMALKQQEAARARSSGGGGGGGGSSSSSSKAGPTMGFKNGKNGAGGFWFKNAAGQPVSAATYAGLTGQAVDMLLTQMVSQGDRGPLAYFQNRLDTNAKNALFWR